MAFRPNRGFGPRPAGMPFPPRMPYNRYDARPQLPYQGMMGDPRPRMDMPWRTRGRPQRLMRPPNENFRGGYRGPRPRSVQPRSIAPSVHNNAAPEMQEAKDFKQTDVSSKTSNERIDGQTSRKLDNIKKEPELINKSETEQKIASSKSETECNNDAADEPVNVVMDSYDCDLHFNTDNTGLTGWTLHENGFEYLWGGGRASHGVSHGKVAFECTVLEALSVNVPATERNPHVLRVGWSVSDADLQLGEDKLSYGYGGTGKISVDSKFTDYGKPFSVGDVITCLADMDSKPRNIFFMVNGKYLGVAFRIGPELKDKELFPHITIKNMRFSVNFGNQWPRYAITPGFTMLQNLAPKDLVRGPVGPKSCQEAEFIMMVGLPACGKTVWAEKHSKENPEKRFYMLGTNNIIEKMRIFGLTRKRNYHGRWDALIKQATGCLNIWLKIAERRIHNYILDQTNVYFTARRRKMGNFREYKRIACVIVNDNNILSERAKRCQVEEGKVVPEEAVMEMKANFSLPEVGETFDEVRYIEEKPPRAQTIVNGFKEEGMLYKKSRKQSGSQEEHSKPKAARLDDKFAVNQQNENIGRYNNERPQFGRFEEQSGSGTFSRDRARFDQRNQQSDSQGRSELSYQNRYQETHGLIDRGQTEHGGIFGSNNNTRNQHPSASFDHRDNVSMRIKEEPIDNPTAAWKDHQREQKTSIYPTYSGNDSRSYGYSQVNPSNANVSSQEASYGNNSNVFRNDRQFETREEKSSSYQERRYTDSNSQHRRQDSSYMQSYETQSSGRHDAYSAQRFPYQTTRQYASNNDAWQEYSTYQRQDYTRHRDFQDRKPPVSTYQQRQSEYEEQRNVPPLQRDFVGRDHQTHQSQADAKYQSTDNYASYSTNTYTVQSAPYEGKTNSSIFSTPGQYSGQALSPHPGHSIATQSSGSLEAPPQPYFNQQQYAAHRFANQSNQPPQTSSQAYCPYKY